MQRISINYTLITPYIISKKITYHKPPIGHMVRGAFGYIALKNQSKLADDFLDVETEKFVFHNMQLSVPAKPEIIKTLSGEHEVFPDNVSFTGTILVDDKNVHDMLYLTELVSQKGIQLGAKYTHGYGSLKVDGYTVDKPEPVKGEAKLLSPCIDKSGTIDISFSTTNMSADRDLVWYNVKGIPIGNKIKSHNGLWAGLYPSLGFGQLI